MKKLISIVVLLLLCMAAYASEVYVVSANSVNMRAKPNGKAKKLGSLYQGQSVKVDTIINGWATCVNETGETFYISSKHLIKKEDDKAKNDDEYDKNYGVPPTRTIQQKIRNVLSAVGIHVKPDSSKNPFWEVLLVPIFCASVIAVLFFILKFALNEEWAYKVRMVLSILVMAYVSIVELQCITLYDGDPAWFCNMDCHAITIIFWLIIVLAIVSTQSCILKTINSFAANVGGATHESLDALGPLSVYIFAAIYLALYLFWTSLQPIVVGLFILSQIVHLILQFIDLKNKSVMPLAAFGLFSICYLLIAVATFFLIVMSVAHLVFLAVNVSIWYYVAAFLFAGGGGGFTAVYDSSGNLIGYIK